MELPVKITGTLTAISDGTIVASSTNDFHLENLSKCIVMALGRIDSGFIEAIQFGDGGSTTSPTKAINYNPPKITGSSSALYNMTYEKVINNRSPNFTGDATKNYIKYEKVAGSTTTRLVINCTLDYAEPSTKYTVSDDILPTDSYTFDEVALVAIDSLSGSRILLTHWISKPITKKLSRAMEFIYTIDFTTTI
jgi:hypothetical protein